MQKSIQSLTELIQTESGDSTDKDGNEINAKPIGPSQILVIHSSVLDYGDSFTETLENALLNHWVKRPGNINAYTKGNEEIYNNLTFIPIQFYKITNEIERKSI